MHAKGISRKCTDNSIYQNGKLVYPFNIFYNYFGIVRDRPPGPNGCAVNKFYQFPPIEQTTFTGKLDEASGFTYFIRLTPETDIAARQSPIINQGIALDAYYTNYGYKLDLEFTYTASPEVSLVEAYYYPTGFDKLYLCVDSYHNLAEYTGPSNTFTLPNLGLIYFKVTSQGNYTLTLSVRCKTPSLIDIYGCPRPKAMCLKFKDIKTKLFTYKDNYVIIPAAQWQAIAELIYQFFTNTALPIPLTPIPIKITTVTLVTPRIDFIGLGDTEFSYYGNIIDGLQGPSATIDGKEVLADESIAGYDGGRYIGYYALTPVLFTANLSGGYTILPNVPKRNVSVNITLFFDSRSVGEPIEISCNYQAPFSWPRYANTTVFHTKIASNLMTEIVIHINSVTWVSVACKYINGNSALFTTQGIIKMTYPTEGAH